MKKLIMLFLMLGTFLFAETSVTTEKFSLDFQNDFSFQEFSIPVGEENLAFGVYLGESEEFASTLTVGNISKEVLETYGTEEILENAINSGIMQTGGEILETKNISLGTYQGKECKYLMTQDEEVYTCYIRAYVVNKEIYVLGAVSLIDDKTLIDKFFNSFKIIK